TDHVSVIKLNHASQLDQHIATDIWINVIVVTVNITIYISVALENELGVIGDTGFTSANNSRHGHDRIKKGCCVNNRIVDRLLIGEAVKPRVKHQQVFTVVEIGNDHVADKSVPIFVDHNV